MNVILRDGQVLSETKGLIGADVLVRDGKIAAVKAHLDGPQCEGAAEYDLAGGLLVPGLVDTHNHGFCGTEFASADERFDDGLLALARCGVTSVAPTVRALPQDRLLAAVANIRREKSRAPFGARILGINLEGPFLSPARIGSMRPENLAPPTPQALDEILSACGGDLLSITVAPELPGVLPLLETVRAAGASAAVGHTDATAEQVRAAADAGANRVTHLFNAMRPFKHRDPGVVGAALTDERLVCELICDYVHNDPVAVDLAIRAKGLDGVVMVSDTGRMAGLGDGEYVIEGKKRVVRGKLCQTEEGVIAGSVCSLFEGFRNLLLHGYPLADVSRLASLNPARAAGLDKRIGSIAVGKCADLMLLDSLFNVKAVWVGGVKVE